MPGKTKAPPEMRGAGQDRCGAEGRNRTDTSREERGILSPLRLPVPPPRRAAAPRFLKCKYAIKVKKLEAASGIEPLNKGFADLRLTTWLCRLTVKHSRISGQF